MITFIKWNGGKSGEHELLASCYRSCLELAVEKGIRSILPEKGKWDGQLIDCFEKEYDLDGVWHTNVYIAVE